MSWRIVAWSAEHGRGCVQGDEGTFDFDRHASMGADFIKDEEVDVWLETRGDLFVVRAVQRAGSRPSHWPREVPTSWRPAIDALRNQLSSLHRVVEVVSVRDDALKLCVHDEQRSYEGPVLEVVFDHVSYAELPSWREYVRPQIATWDEVSRDPDRVDRLGLGAGQFARDEVVVVLEPAQPDDHSGVIVARSATVVR